MVELEIFSRATIHTTGAVATINSIDHLARNRRALRLIPEELPGIDKFHPDLLFKPAPALPFFQFQGYLGLFAFQRLTLTISRSGVPFSLALFLFFQVFQITLMLAFFPFFGLPGMLAPEFSGTLLLRPFFLCLFFLQALQHTTGAKPSPDAPDAPQKK